MNRHATILTFALAVPLALYGIPYAYATSTETTYQVTGATVILSHASSNSATSQCNNGDMATGGGYLETWDINLGYPIVVESHSFNSPASTFPNGWTITAINPYSTTLSLTPYVMCLTPITVAGIGVPQFGSMYLAIVLGALVYFVIARRNARVSGIQ